MTNEGLYLDQVKKLAYYKQFLVEEYLSKGKDIDKSSLEAELEEIDSKVAIFSQRFVENGSVLDVDSYNKQKNDIYADLCILYEVLFELAEKRLSALEHMIDCEIESLTERARKLQNRLELEAQTLAGEPLYYATNGFEQEYRDGRIYINLGSLSIPSGARLACICDSDEADSSDILFRFGDRYQTVDYRHDNNLLWVAGNYKLFTTNFVSEEEKDSSFKIDYESVIKGNTYNLFAGKSKIKIKHYDTGIVEYKDKVPDIYYTAEDECEISFYVYGASFINIETLGETTYTSFDSTEIKAPKLREKITISCKPKFRLDLLTDGTIYSDMTGCSINRDELYSGKGFRDIHDYMLEEISYGEDISFDNVNVIVENAEDTFIDINYIAIKYVYDLEYGEKETKDDYL